MHNEWIPNKEESSIADVQLSSKYASKYCNWHPGCGSSDNLSAI